MGVTNLASPSSPLVVLVLLSFIAYLVASCLKRGIFLMVMMFSVFQLCVAPAAEAVSVGRGAWGIETLEERFIGQCEL